MTLYECDECRSIFTKEEILDEACPTCQYPEFFPCGDTGRPAMVQDSPNDRPCSCEDFPCCGH